MKRTISIIAAISMCMSFALCGTMSKILANASGTGTELQVRPLITFEEDIQGASLFISHHNKEIKLIKKAPVIL